MRVRAARRDGEHLCGEVLPASLLQPTVTRQSRPMLLDRRQELGHVLAVQRLRQQDGRSQLRLRERDDRAHLVQHRLRGRVIHLVDRDDVGDLHDPGLECLHRVAGARHEDEEHRVRDPGDLDLALSCADGLDEHDVLSGGVEEEDGLQRRLGESAEMPTRAHRADVDAGVEEVVGEPDSVAEQRTVREGARRIDRDDADRPLARPHEPDECADESSTSRRRAGR